MRFGPCSRPCERIWVGGCSYELHWRVGGRLLDALGTRVQLGGDAHGLSQFVSVAERHSLAFQAIRVALSLSGFDDAERVAQQLILDDRAWIDAGVLRIGFCGQLHATVLDMHGAIGVFAYITSLPRARSETGVSTTTYSTRL